MGTGKIPPLRGAPGFLGNTCMPSLARALVRKRLVVQRSLRVKSRVARLTRPSFAGAKLAQGKSACRWVKEKAAPGSHAPSFEKWTLPTAEGGQKRGKNRRGNEGRVSGRGNHSQILPWQAKKSPQLFVGILWLGRPRRRALFFSPLQQQRGVGDDQHAAGVVDQGPHHRV